MIYHTALPLGHGHTDYDALLAYVKQLLYGRGGKPGDNNNYHNFELSNTAIFRYGGIKPLPIVTKD